MKLAEISSRIKQRVEHLGSVVVIFEPESETAAEANLATFDSLSGELIQRYAAPVSTQADAWVNAWVRDGKLFIGSWSGYEYELNCETRRLENGKLTK
jgi:hypothetical protein